MAKHVIIPRSELGNAIKEVRRLKREALSMLSELETSYLGAQPEKPGGWRQTTTEFLRRKRP